MNNQPVSPAILQLQNVTKTVAQTKNNHWAVVRDVSFTVSQGEFVMLYGPSGSGKSTLLKIMAGLESPTQGDVLFRGESLTKKKANELARFRLEEVGLVFSQRTLLPYLTIIENIALPDQLSGARSKTTKERAANLLSQIGLEQFAHYYPGQVASAVRQKCIIVRSLVKNPAILLVNDPTRDLDTASAQGIMELFVDLNRSADMTIFMVTHNPEHVYYPNRVIYFQDGTMTREVVNRPVVTNYFPANAAPSAPLPVVAAI